MREITLRLYEMPYEELERVVDNLWNQKRLRVLRVNHQKVSFYTWKLHNVQRNHRKSSEEVM